MELSRRDFLKASAGAAGLLALQPASLAKAAQATGDVAMLIDVTKCVSCWWCYAACKEQHNLPETVKPDPADPPKLAPAVWTTLRPVQKDGGWVSRKQACNHCTDAACVSVCPTGALSYNRLGFVQYDREKCSGCGYCAEFCPFEVPQLDGNGINVDSFMNKCTFCQERVTNGEPPACAAACPNGAITYGQRQDLLRQGRERVAELRRGNPAANLYGAEELGGLHILYVLDDAPEVYGLPANPQLPAVAVTKDIFGWLGLGAAAAIIVGFVLNYVVAREAIMADKLPGKEYKRKRKQ